MEFITNVNFIIMLIKMEHLERGQNIRERVVSLKNLKSFVRGIKDLVCSYTV